MAVGGFLSAALALTPVSLYTSEICLGHDPGNKGKLPDGKPNRHPEQVARLERLLSAARNEWTADFGDALKLQELECDVTEEQLLRVHSRKYLDRLNYLFAQSQRGPPFMRVNLDGDTVLSQGTAAAATRAAGLVVKAVEDVLSTAPETRRAFVMVRPPGHHAEADMGGGFCFYNNVLVGVAHAQAVHNIGRVAILDFDVHHGNGDSDISWCDPTRLYASTHEEALWPGTGATWGCDGLHGQILSCPLPPGCGSKQFRAAWKKTLLPTIAEFEPEVIFLSAGFDAHLDDPLASMELSDDDFEWITTEVAALGGGNLPIVSVLEGGYNVDALEGAVRAHLHALINS